MMFARGGSSIQLGIPATVSGTGFPLWEAISLVAVYHQTGPLSEGTAGAW